jgi:hypothetical protein
MNVWIFKAQANYTLRCEAPRGSVEGPAHEDPKQESASSRFRILDDVSTSYF